jgi:hypothetical protein
MIQVQFIDDKALSDFQKLGQGRSEDVFTMNLILRAKEKLLLNPFSGVIFKKERIPRDYLIKYNIENLWKFNLSDNWRMIYSIVRDEETVIILIIEWFDHKDYERRFGY